jgi:hypothetical protein
MGVMKTRARCRCGHDLENPFVVPELHFSPPKWVLLCFGATPYPSRVDYHCTVCDTTIGTTKDPDVLHAF